ncbi:MAG: hypothetical protein P4L77_03640 [Sulfuriferula sp.]|nr:hypothetical protein [Sulfuriferula sp.]
MRKALPESIRWPAVAAIVIAYAVLANYTNQSAQTGALGALVALAPIVLTVLTLMWRSAQRRYLPLLAALATGAAWLAWPLLTRHYDWLYWLEHESLQWALLLTFARTLIAGRQPLCTQFAEILHGPLTPAHVRYAHRVTIAWTVFFALMILTSTGLFFLQPVAVWSIFANFVFLPLVVLMFIAEYAVRKRVLPAMPHSSIMDAVHAFMQHSKSAPRR